MDEVVGVVELVIPEPLPVGLSGDCYGDNNMAQ